jgi:hypothetical protein
LPPAAGLCRSPAAALPTTAARGRGGTRSTWQTRRLQQQQQGVHDNHKSPVQTVTESLLRTWTGWQHIARAYAVGWSQLNPHGIRTGAAAACEETQSVQQSPG